MVCKSEKKYVIFTPEKSDYAKKSCDSRVASKGQND